MELKVNNEFSSLKDLESAISSYSRKNYVDLHKRDARTINQATKEKKISEDRVKNKELKYYQVKYTCIYGGRNNFKGRGEGARKTKTFQRGCEFFIQVRLADSGDHLVVTNMHGTNHDVDVKEYSFLPKVRKLTNEDLEHASDLIAVGANKKIVQQQLSNSTGK